MRLKRERNDDVDRFENRIVPSSDELIELDFDLAPSAAEDDE